MMYSYACSKCDKVTEKDFPMGKAKSSVKCSCGKKAERVYSFSVQVNDPISLAREGRGKG